MHSATIVPPRGFLLPFKIAIATAAASDPTRITLKSAERCLLCYLLQRVSAAAPNTPFRCRVDRLADEFGVTTRSVHNWLTGLRESGLLQFKQRRNQFGSFGLAAVLSDKAIDLLGLLKTPELRVFHQQEKPLELVSRKIISDTEIPGNNLINIQPNGDSCKTKKGDLPPDVRCLHTEHDLTTPTIFWLMKQASVKANRLGSILQVAGKYLAGKSPGAVKAYLMKCINSGRDYDAPPTYGDNAVQEVTLRGMHKVLATAVEANDGMLSMRGNSCLGFEQDTLYIFRRSTNGVLFRAGVVSGDALQSLYDRFLQQGHLA